MIPIEPIDFWRYGELIALIPMLIGVIILVLYSRMKSGGYRSTISQTISQSFVTQRIFSPVMTLFFPFYYGFLWFWVGPHVNAPLLFYVLLALAAVAEIVAIWVPARGRGLSSRTHTIAASAVGLVMIATTVLIMTGTTSMAGVIATAIFLATTAMLVLIFTIRGRSTNLFALEVIFFAAYIIAMSVAAHT